MILFVKKPVLTASQEVTLQIDIQSYYQWRYRYHGCSFPKSTDYTKMATTLYLEPILLQLEELN